MSAGSSALARFALSDKERMAYVDSIATIGMAAIEARGRGAPKGAAAATRKEAAAVVDAAVQAASSAEDLRLRVAKMARKLDPQTAVTTFLQQRSLLQRAVTMPGLQRERPLLEQVLARGEDRAVLVQALDEVKKANSIAVKALRALEIVAVTNLRTMAAKVEGIARAATPGAARALADLATRIDTELQNLALAPAMRAFLNQPLQALKQLQGGGAVAQQQALVLLQALAAVLVSMTEDGEAATRANVEEATAVPRDVPRFVIGVPQQ